LAERETTVASARLINLREDTASMRKPQGQQAPQGMAGLVRYFDEDKSVVKLTPQHVAIACGVLIIAELIVMAVL
jgi:preprotein translocase subunit Sec61beta